MNWLQMAKQVKHLQGEMKKAKADLARQSVTGSAAHGAVQIEISGAMEVRRVSLDPAWLAQTDPAQVERQLADACNQALRQVQKLMSNRLSPLAGGLGLGGLNPLA